jgi:hypothetical protein
MLMFVSEPSSSCNVSLFVISLTGQPCSPIEPLRMVSLSCLAPARVHASCCCAVGRCKDLPTAIRQRDLAVLAVHGRKERNPAAPATLMPVSRYSEREVKAVAVALQKKVGGARVCSL